MGISTLIGIADGTTPAAAMYCNTTGRMVGPIWEAEDAPDQIEAFLEWVRCYSFIPLTEEIELGSGDVPSPEHDQSNDVRVWPAWGLDKLVKYWRAQYVGDDGLLRLPATEGETA